MHMLRCRLSDSLWHALQARHRATGESIEHIVSAALADRLQVDHSTLFQISSSAAVVEGIYKGEVTVGALREHGDFGLGTFTELDGEMILVDGRCYQVRSDGVAREAGNDARTPFAVVTRFVPDRSLDDVACATLAELSTELDALRDSQNVFYAIRIDGDLAADRKAGGHVLECRGRGLRVRIQRELDLRVSLPHTAEFLKAELTRDTAADLDKAEH